MIHIQTSTFGLLDTQARQHEYLLVLSALDCALRGRGDWIADVMTWFQADFIADSELRAIYQAILDLQQSGDPVDEFALLTRLPVGDALPFQSKAAKLYGLWRDCASQSAHLRYYAKQVHAEFRRQHAAADLVGLAEEIRETTDVDAALGEVGEVITRYAPAAETRSTDNQRVMDDLYAELEGRREHDRFEFGIRSLDRIVGGLAPGVLCTIGARSSCGKSVLLGQSAIKCALYDRKPAIVFSQEMSQSELFKRWTAHLSRQPFGHGERRETGSALLRINQLIKDGLLHIFTGPKTVEQVAAETMAYAARQPLGLVVVDYVQAVSPTRSRAEGREQQVAHIAGALKALAMRTGTPVLTASQLNKQGEDNPRGSTLRESEAILNYSNVVILLHIDAKDRTVPVCPIDLIADKVRDGAQDVAVAVWEKPIFTIRDCDEHDPPRKEATR